MATIEASKDIIATINVSDLPTAEYKESICAMCWQNPEAVGLGKVMRGAHAVLEALGIKAPPSCEGPKVLTSKTIIDRKGNYFAPHVIPKNTEVCSKQLAKQLIEDISTPY
jgi:hypothetical protein